MRRVYGAKVMRLTPGGLLICLVLGAPRGAPRGEQESAEAKKPLRTAARAEHEEPNRFDAFEA